MKILFIGGSGNISEACTQLAHARGMEVTLLNRGQRKNTQLPQGLKTIQADINDLPQAAAALKGHTFDVVANFIAFTPEQVQRDIDLFSGKTGQYIFISSASAYQKPPKNYLVTEDTPLENPHWEYSRNKAACEALLWKAFHESKFPATVVRPSLTYSRVMLPCAMGGHDYTVIDRIRKGQPLVVHGDGTSLWVMTHARDFALAFVGMLGKPESLGQAYHITSDEVLNWDQIYTQIAEAAGAKPKFVHIPTDFIVKHDPSSEGSLLGDKSWSLVFDNSKIKRLVPDYKAVIPFIQGMKESVAWMDADPSRRTINQEANQKLDSLIAAFGKI
jgi:nucleoside-diphosphate-sugar epimerase